MLVKGLVLTALVASTPLALVARQDPRPAAANPERPASAPAASAEAARLAAQATKAGEDLATARRELSAARDELRQMRHQLEQALDALDRTYEPQRDRNCSPSRSRALMSHYQWLRDQGHQQRAAGVLARVVDEAGDDLHRLQRAAFALMTDEETAGRFDEVALAFAERMEKSGQELDHRLLDTLAMARFLNGQVDRAVELQRLAVERGGRSDEFRRRLRTYQAAQAAVAKAGKDPAAPAATLVAGGGE